MKSTDENRVKALLLVGIPIWVVLAIMPTPVLANLARTYKPVDVGGTAQLGALAVKLGDQIPRSVFREMRGLRRLAVFGQCPGCSLVEGERLSEMAQAPGILIIDATGSNRISASVAGRLNPKSRVASIPVAELGKLATLPTGICIEIDSDGSVTRIE